MSVVLVSRKKDVVGGKSRILKFEVCWVKSFVIPKVMKKAVARFWASKVEMSACLGRPKLRSAWHISSEGRHFAIFGSQFVNCQQSINIICIKTSLRFHDTVIRLSKSSSNLPLI